MGNTDLAQQSRSGQTADRIREIRAFWEGRALQFGTKPQATLGETYLRELEIRTMSRVIARCQPRLVLDAGCGNGYSTKAFAGQFPAVSFVGVDYSTGMINQAATPPVPNCSFQVGSVLEADGLPNGPFDLVLTQRCIQNLPDYETQKAAIRNLIERLAGTGLLVLMECSKDGVEQLNRTRVRLGRPPIQGIEPWHNCFLRDDSLRRDFGAEVTHFSSTYMFLTRLVSERLARVACRLPSFGRFGYDKLYSIRPHQQPTAAATPVAGNR